MNHYSSLVVKGGRSITGGGVVDGKGAKKARKSKEGAAKAWKDFMKQPKLKKKMK